ncbi:MAG: hypothetical protein J3K34DRAFT_518479 [Monoraphidium minutum]|nr:MAG: hypothetical protein J3K34DRAFT_518479 [Monoraphidium minutum]
MAMMMHSTSSTVSSDHPVCAEFLQALSQCQKDNTAAVWWGACSDAKTDLTACLAAAAELEGPKAQQQPVAQPQQPPQPEPWRWWGGRGGGAGAAQREEQAGLNAL